MRMRKRTIRWIGSLSALLLLVLGVTLALPVAWGQGDDVLPPHVFDTMPLPGEELPLDGAVTFFFDQPMDADSVGTAFSVDPVVAGALSWPDEASLVFTPSGEYTRAAEYTFTIGTGAQSVAGAAMEEAFTLALQTVGYLEVSEVLPAPDSSAVDTDSIITVIFNRPVVPLLSVEDMGNLPHPLTFDPPVEGSGEWLNTSIYLFTPSGELQGGTNYTLTIPAGLEDVTGGVLAEDYSWRFSTLRPDVLEITPNDDYDRARLDQKVTVRFSQAMNPATIDAGFELVKIEGDLPVIPVPGTFEWSEDFRSVTFTPDEQLQLESRYRVDIEADLVLSSTGATLREDATSRFYTLPYPQIRNTSPHDGEQNAWPYGGFTIYFNTLMDLDSLEGKVIIDPEPWREYDTYFYDWGYNYSLSFDTEPATEYTITILPGMADIYGNTIDEGMVVTYTTAPYPPELTVQATGRVGMYNAYNPTTRVFLTHRNVSRVDLGLWNVPLTQFARMVGPDSYDYWRNYEPAMTNALRRWSIDVSSQQDRRRYELLLISDKGPSGISNIQCLAAPDPQVKVGDVVIVTPDDPTPLNIRTEPDLAANVITQVLPGETLQVIGGPFCEGGFLWWQVRLNNDIIGWAAEGTQENYFYAPLGAAPADPNLAGSEGAGQPYQPEALDPGLYFLEISSPETGSRDDYSRRHLMLVATANITLKFSQDTALAWITDLQSGEPLAGVPVIFYNENFNPIGQTNTGADGLAVIELRHLEDLYTTLYATVDTRDAATGAGAFGFAVSRWTDGMDPWMFDLYQDYDPEDRTVYLYTDRPIYRPNQPVYFRGIIRNQHDVSYSLPGLETVPVQIYDDRGEVIYNERLPVTPQGSFSGELQLDPEAPLGYYRIVAEVRSNNRESFGLSFSVAEYRTPEFQVDAVPAADQVVQGDTVQVAVEASYFFGGAVSDASVSWSVLARDYYFRYTGPETGYWSFVNENYDFYSPEYYGPSGGVIAEGEGTTDGQGRFLVEVPADLGSKGISQTYTIEARVVDESDQLVAGRATVTVHQGLVYVGVQPVNYVGRAERENKVNLLAVDWDSEPVAGQEIEYEVVERRWFSVQEEDSMGRTVWTWEVEETPVDGASGTVISGENGLAQISFTPPAGGVYKIYATTTDEKGNQVRSSAFTWVSGRNFVNWRQENNNRIQLITDKDEYTVGDTAQILIPSPFQGSAYALITVERGDLISQEVVLMESNSTIFELPILPEHAPNIFVSVVLVKGVDENNPTAAFRMGVTQINVDTSRLVMDIEIEPNIDVDAGEFAGPGDTVEYTITATDWQGTPVPNAEVGLGLTDLAVLTIADPNSPELLPFFYSERGITVVTSSPLTINVDQATQIIIDTIKGGGGGYGEGGIFEVRQEFVDTPLWEPSVITDENGQATVSVTLPDNLTTWRMDARAVTTGEDGPMLVGQNTSDLLSTKPVLIRPTTGRFFIVGDRATLAAVVNNNTSQDMLAEVTLEGSGFVLGDDVPNSQWVEIPAKGRARVNWPVEVQDVPFVDATFYVNANNGQYTDASKPPLGQGEDRTLPVYKYEAPETVGTAGTLYGPDASSRTEAIVLPRRYNVTQGELTVRLDRSLAAATVDGMTWLRNYPYYCIEQIVSRFLPNAVTLRSLRDLGLDDPVLEANLQIQVSYALQRLYSQQKPDGGWGWFPTDESNPIVTAYALIGLTEAQRAGFDINTGVVSRAANFVGESLRTIRPQDNLWQVNRQAFLLYALAWSGRGNVSATVRLFDERETMSLFAKAYLAMTFHLIDPDDTRAMELVNDLNNALIVSATGGHWEETYQDWWNWNTNTRTTALGLMAMAQIDPDNQLIPNVVRWLMVARTADHWETTQETAWSVMALTEWMVVTGELYPDYEFAVSLNGARQSLDDNTATPDNVKETEVLRIQVADLIEDVNRLTFSRTDGDGNLYYTAHLTAYLPVPEIEALDRGIILSRKYSLLDDPESKPVTSAEVGQPVQVTLTIIAPNNLHYVVIEDPFPAGADAVNPNLNTSSIVGTRPTLNRDRPLSRGWGWWWFSNIEMRDEKVVLYATYLPRGTYQFNYVIYPGLAGEYNVIPTTGQEFYFPEVYGRADGSQFTITGGTPSDAIEPPADTAADTAEANAGFEEAPADSSAGADSQADETADSAEGEEFPLLWDVLEADGRFGTLLDLFVEAGLDSVLLSPDLLTVFAPTDDALAALPEHLASNPDTLALVLLYHLLDEAYYEEDLGNYQFVTLMGETILVIPVDDVISLDHMAEITETDLEAANGVIHVIDGVLIPPTLAKLSAEDVAADHTAPQIEIGAVDAESKDDEAKDDESDAAETESGDDMTAEDTDSGPVEQGTDIPLPPLTESYTTADGLTFSYPVDWVVEDVGSGPVTLASDAATAESQIVTPGTVGINFLQPEFVSSILFLSEGPPADVLNEYRGDSVNENEAITWGEIEDIMLGDRIAAFLTVSNISEEFNVEGIIIALDVSDTVGAGAVLLVIGAAYPGELEMWQPLLLDIAASLSYTPTETPDEAESDSTDETGETGETGAAEESAEPQQFEAVESAGADESVEIGEPGESEGVEESAEPAAAEPSDLIGMMLADGRFEMVGNLVATQPDLRALLEGDEPVTIFLPVDDAFLDVSSDLITTLMSDPGLLIAALQYHMVAGALMIEDLSDLDTITTIEGTDIALSVDADGNLVLNDIVMVIEADIEATNGVIHVIDGVLLVPDEE